MIFFKRTPKVGDKVKVAVGFSSFLNEGIVSSVYKDYCWIDQFYMADLKNRFNENNLNFIAKIFFRYSNCGYFSKK